MNREELVAAATCAECGKKFGAGGAPVFYRCKLTQYVVNIDAVRRQDTLSVVLGSAQLAELMCADDGLATAASTKEFTVCAACAHVLPLHLLEEP